MKAAEEASRQREQLARYLEWVEKEGGVEGPIRLSTYMQNHQKFRLQWLKAHVVGSLLEVGCNSGYVLAWCGGGVGVDINMEVLMLAGILAPLSQFRSCDAGQLAWPDQAFDTVMLADVLEHIRWEDVRTAVKEAARVAAKRVLVTLPDGSADTQDATNLKHAWLATDERVTEIVQTLPGNVSITRQMGFVLICCDLETK